MTNQSKEVGIIDSKRKSSAHLSVWIAGLLVLILSMFIGLIFAPVMSEARQASGTNTITFTIPPLQSMVIGSESSTSSLASSFTIPKPTVEDLNRGSIERPTAETLIVMSNIPWVVKVRTEDRDMGTSFDGGYTMPIDRFQLRESGNRYISIDNFDQILVNGAPGRYEIGVDYRVLLNGEQYQDGDYHIVVIYTITTD
ncbi:MAG: hypothetical protein ACE5JP_04205 [Candidatus Bipolaricaulia bacterium]